MALPETDILTILKTFSDLTAFVSQRVHASDELPQGVTYPCVNFFEVSGGSVSSFQGSSGLGFGRFQFNCWSPSFAEAKKIRDAVRRALTGKDVSFAGTALQSANVLNKVDMPKNQATKNYQSVIDIGIHYTEAQT